MFWLLLISQACARKLGPKGKGCKLFSRGAHGRAIGYDKVRLEGKGRSQFMKDQDRFGTLILYA